MEVIGTCVFFQASVHGRSVIFGNIYWRSSKDLLQLLCYKMFCKVNNLVVDFFNVGIYMHVCICKLAKKKKKE